MFIGNQYLLMCCVSVVREGVRVAVLFVGWLVAAR